MSEVKPVIKTITQRLNGVVFSGNRVELSIEEFCAIASEATELRAALEALQAENAEQAKRIAELEKGLANHEKQPACEVCGGSGYVPSHLGQFICPACNGSGVEK